MKLPIRNSQYRWGRCIGIFHGLVCALLALAIGLLGRKAIRAISNTGGDALNIETEVDCPGELRSDDDAAGDDEVRTQQELDETVSTWNQSFSEMEPDEIEEGISSDLRFPGDEQLSSTFDYTKLADCLKRMLKITLRKLSQVECEDASSNCIISLVI